MSSKQKTPAMNLEEASEYAYFNNYARLGIHRKMISDRVRTEAYRDAILRNKHLFKNRVVLDIGCGTGILSMFAAQAGAFVIGIDNSNIADYAEQIVLKNGFAGKIKIIKGKVEDIKELPYNIHQVDIIISEWMGYCLNYEWMLETVLYARDRWLNREFGLMFPDKVSLYLTATSDDRYRKKHIDCWKDLYGFKFTPIQQFRIWEPAVCLVDPVNIDFQIVGTHCEVIEYDLNTIYVEQLQFKRKFNIALLQDCTVTALIGYFNIEFSACHTPVGFSTGPHETPTHWKQTVFHFREPFKAEKGEVIEGSLVLRKHHRIPRGLDIFIIWAVYNNEWFGPKKRQQFALC